MNSIWLTGTALIALGLAGLFSTGAATATIPAILGLIFLALAWWGNQPDRAATAASAAAGVAVLGILATLGNLARIFSGSFLPLSAAGFASLSMGAACALYLAVWAWERRAAVRG